MNTLLAEQDLAALKQAVHQLKGAGVADMVSPASRKWPAWSKSASSPKPILNSIRKEVDSLVNLVRTVQGYDRNPRITPADGGRGGVRSKAIPILLG